MFDLKNMNFLKLSPDMDNKLYHEFWLTNYYKSLYYILTHRYGEELKKFWTTLPEYDFDKKIKWIFEGIVYHDNHADILKLSKNTETLKLYLEVNGYV